MYYSELITEIVDSVAERAFEILLFTLGSECVYDTYNDETRNRII